MLIARTFGKPALETGVNRSAWIIWTQQISSQLSYVSFSHYDHCSPRVVLSPLTLCPLYASFEGYLCHLHSKWACCAFWLYGLPKTPSLCDKGQWLCWKWLPDHQTQIEKHSSMCSALTQNYKSDHNRPAPLQHLINALHHRASEFSSRSWWPFSDKLILQLISAGPPL